MHLDDVEQGVQFRQDGVATRLAGAILARLYPHHRRQRGIVARHGGDEEGRLIARLLAGIEHQFRAIAQPGLPRLRPVLREVRVAMVGAAGGADISEIDILGADGAPVYRSLIGGNGHALHRIFIGRRRPVQGIAPEHSARRDNKKQQGQQPAKPHGPCPALGSKSYAHCLMCSTQMRVNRRRAVSKSTSILPSSRSISISAA